MLRRTRTLKSGKVWESFYYNGRDGAGRRVEIPLGPDLNEAKRKWAELECREPAEETGLMRFVFDRYEREAIPTKAPRTQKDYLASLMMLRKVFDAVPISVITPQHIALYRDKRGAKAPVRANRDISVFSNVWNMAREWGFTAQENPAKGIRKNKETPRDYYAAADVWGAVYAVACDELRDAMDLNYLTGQRPADVLKMRLSDIRDGALEVQQGKTKKKLRILLMVGGLPTELGKVIERIRARPRKVASLALMATPAGTALNRWTLRTRFDEARAVAAKHASEAGSEQLAARIREFQFRDIRPKAASETDLDHASKLLGHTKQDITQKVYRRVGETVNPTR
ncbi:tyrosine-type recombinase/integrase [Comamonas koreensis]|uniref:Tyrosine-type recombinase/integrase n=1 Tax=Comamonas koreensis TaxID=160825 RepID=A0AAW4XR67_9BURK|nr:tyrosine-type recombinase/integrase [Comamonas koreensis]MCD2163832.1 tyrosine-type recombinase/integrase [Comamonas koreensis]